MPDSESDPQNEYVPTDEELDRKVSKKHIQELRRGVKLKSRSRTVDRMAGMSMGEYQQYLREKSGKEEGVPRRKASAAKSAAPSQGASPIKGRLSKPNATLPKRPNAGASNSPSNIMGNDPIAADSDMGKILKMAMNGAGGFKMDNRLKRKLSRSK